MQGHCRRKRLTVIAGTSRGRQCGFKNSQWSLAQPQVQNELPPQSGLSTVTCPDCGPRNQRSHSSHKPQPTGSACSEVLLPCWPLDSTPPATPPPLTDCTLEDVLLLAQLQPGQIGKHLCALVTKLPFPRMSEPLPSLSFLRYSH